MSAKTRSEAIAMGLTRYFTGEPCGRGHVSERSSSDGKCVACKRENWRASVARSPGAVARAKKKYRDKNREKLAVAYAEYVARDPEKVRKQKRDYAARNQERERVRAREKYYANRDAYIARSKARNAQRRGAGGTFNADDIAAIMKRQRSRCAYCQVKLTSKTKTIDHIVPVARGGTNAPSNLQITCMPCNRRKSARCPTEFARSTGRLL